MRLVVFVALGLVGAIAVTVLLLMVSPAAGAITLAAILFGGAIALLAGSHAGSTTYDCPNCGHDFKIDAATDLLSPHTLTAKWLLCPKCDKHVWAKERSGS